MPQRERPSRTWGWCCAPAAHRINGFGVLALLTLGCGASFESVYESNVRFEHCYRLDHDPQIASPHREYCWKQWVHTYTYGQSQDRVDYAQRRIRVLRGEPPPGVSVQHGAAQESTGAGASQQAADDNASEPAAAQPAAPTVPEPAVASVPQGATAELPQELCTTGCKDELRRCRDGCQTAPKGCAPCEPNYTACMRGCFE